MDRIVRTAAVLSILLACGTTSAGELVAPGIERVRIETRSADDAQPMNVWIYRPIATRAESLPTVLIAASGSNGLNGAALDEAQTPEHLAFAREGCIVVAFDVDGAIDTQTAPEQYTAQLGAFMKSEGGLANARAALHAAERAEPKIDTNRLFAAGHGSGANVALNLAAADERIRAVVAFSPLDDAVARVGDSSIDAISTVLPGFRAFLERSQPLAIAPRVRARVMLFHPADDAIAPLAATRELAERMKAAGNEPVLEAPRAGGHVEGMISRGLELGATWIAEMARRIPATQPGR